MDYKALKTQIRRPTIQKLSKYLFLLIVLSVVGVSFAKSAGNASTTTIPKPFFFTENKGQWDERVLYKCDAGSGLIWFLERDGFTLLATAVDKTLPPASGGTQGGVRDPMDRDLPEMLRRHPPRYPKKGHALKFKFVKEDIPPLLPPHGVSGDNLSPSQAGGQGGVLLPASAKYFEGKSYISQPFSNNVQDIPPLLPPNGVMGDNLSPSQAGGRGGVYLPASAKYYEGLGELPWKNNYFLGNDSTKWAPNCRNFTSVYYKDVWEGIDIEWYESNGKLEFDFIVQPGANPEQIRIEVEGLDGALSLPPAGGGTQGGVDIAIGQKESHPPLVPPAQQGGKAKNDGGINNPSEPPQPKDVEGDKGTPPKSPKPVSRTADKLKGENNPPAVRGGFRGGQTVGDELILPTSLGELRTVLPKVYQIDGSGHIIDIPAKFQLIGNNDKRIHPPIAPPFTEGKANVPITDESHTGSNNDKGFEISKPKKTVNTFGVTLPEGYNPAHPLRIDPLIYSTFLGGSGDDFVNDAIIDSDGGVIVVGDAGSSNFPHTLGQYNGGFSDCILAKLNSDGSQLVYSVMFGGSNIDYVKSIAITTTGGVLITGDTGSGNFPVTSGTPQGNIDCFFMHITNLGTTLLFSVRFGGSQDDYARELVIDTNNGCYITGYTNSSNFPTTIGVISPTYNGTGQLWWGDGFIVYFTNNGTFTYSTYLGGSGDDWSNTILIDSLGRIYVAGWTNSTNFPTTTFAYDTTFNGGIYGDCFIACLNQTLSVLNYSTFIGGSAEEYLSRLALRDGLITMIGKTASTDFPITASAYFSNYLGGTADGFICKLPLDLSTLQFSSFLGGSGQDYCSTISYDNEGNMWIGGGTYSLDLPTTHIGYDTTFNGDIDGFLLCVLSGDTHITYCSYLGGFMEEYVREIIPLNSLECVLIGITTSSNFPTTSDGFSRTHNGGFDFFISRILFDTISTIRIYPSITPNHFTLFQNYPNPFNSSTTVSYSLLRAGVIDLKLYDLMGREVSTIVNRWQTPGNHRVVFDGKNLTSGVYLVQMKAGEFMQTRKIVVMK